MLLGQDVNIIKGITEGGIGFLFKAISGGRVERR